MIDRYLVFEARDITETISYTDLGKLYPGADLQDPETLNTIYLRLRQKTDPKAFRIPPYLTVYTAVLDNGNMMCNAVEPLNLKNF
jgi:hypothetical protein